MKLYLNEILYVSHGLNCDATYIRRRDYFNNYGKRNMVGFKFGIELF